MALRGFLHGTVGGRYGTFMLRSRNLSVFSCYSATILNRRGGRPSYWVCRPLYTVTALGALERLFHGRVIVQHYSTIAVTGLSCAGSRHAGQIAGICPYYRVSTDRQGRSGLGLEAQREAVRHHLAGVGGTLISEHTEIETGKRNDRIELQNALACCRRHKAKLVIAKLDRFSRNVAFIAAMMDSRVEFVACDNPHATRLTLHILAAVAEHEREMIAGNEPPARAIEIPDMEEAREVRRNTRRLARRFQDIVRPHFALCREVAYPKLDRFAFLRRHGIAALDYRDTPRASE
jgi:hypothetical protein